VLQKLNLEINNKEPMVLSNINPTTTKAWQKLQHHYDEMKSSTLQDLFLVDDNRAKKFHLKWNDFLVDYSKNHIDSKTLDLLLELANEVSLQDAIQKYFNGDNINVTEKRAVLHTALRAKETDVIEVNGKNIIPEISAAKLKMKSFSNDIINGNKTGYTHKKLWLSKHYSFIQMT
jgi:glucose-6-phosphate isomerase